MTGRRSAGTALVAVAALLMLTVTVARPPGAAAASGRVLFVGDSVMEGAASALPGALPGREVVVDTQVSRSTGATATAAATHGTDWQAVVVLVGHNDGGSASVYQPAYRRLLDQFAAVPHVFVMTIHEARPYYAGVNAFLRDEAARRPNVTVLDWNAIVDANPGSVGHDGLHLTSSGAQLMARSAAQAIDDAVAAATTTTVPTTAPPPPPTVTVAAPPPTLAPVPPSSAPAASTTTTPPATTGTSGPSAPARAAAPAPAGPTPPGPHTPTAAVPLVLAGALLLVGGLERERRVRHGK